MGVYVSTVRAHVDDPGQAPAGLCAVQGDGLDGSGPRAARSLMSTPTESDYVDRVMIERMVGGIPRRVHVVLRTSGDTTISFPSDMSEDEATLLVQAGLDMIRPINVRQLFEPPVARTKRRIETEE